MSQRAVSLKLDENNVIDGGEGWRYCASAIPAVKPLRLDTQVYNETESVDVESPVENECDGNRTR